MICAHGPARLTASNPVSSPQPGLRLLTLASSIHAPLRSTGKLLQRDGSSYGCLGRESDCVIVGSYTFPRYFRRPGPTVTQPALLRLRRNRGAPMAYQLTYSRGSLLASRVLSPPSYGGCAYCAGILRKHRRFPPAQTWRRVLCSAKRVRTQWLIYLLSPSKKMLSAVYC